VPAKKKNRLLSPNRFRLDPIKTSLYRIVKLLASKLMQNFKKTRRIPKQKLFIMLKVPVFQNSSRQQVPKGNMKAESSEERLPRIHTLHPWPTWLTQPQP